MDWFSTASFFAFMYQYFGGASLLSAVVFFCCFLVLPIILLCFAFWFASVRVSRKYNNNKKSRKEKKKEQTCIQIIFIKYKRNYNVNNYWALSDKLFVYYDFIILFIFVHKNNRKKRWNKIWLPIIHKFLTLALVANYKSFSLFIFLPL